MTSLEFAIAQLRHAYKNALDGQIGDQRAFARGLLGPAIERVEEHKAAHDALAARAGTPDPRLEQPTIDDIPDRSPLRQKLAQVEQERDALAAEQRALRAKVEEFFAANDALDAYHHTLRVPHPVISRLDAADRALRQSLTATRPPEAPEVGACECGHLKEAHAFYSFDCFHDGCDCESYREAPKGGSR